MANFSNILCVLCIFKQTSYDGFFSFLLQHQTTITQGHVSRKERQTNFIKSFSHSGGKKELNF